MPNPWRQGDRIKAQDAVSLGLIAAEQADTASIIVVSHSCDVAADADDEPLVEVIVGSIVPEAEAKFQNGHSIHSLNLHADTQGGKEFTLYCMHDRKQVEKCNLLRFEPYSECRHPEPQRSLLRRWLSQRYNRSEFPDAFISWLKESGVGERFEKVGKSYSQWLEAIYFDLDDATERTDPTDPYALGISLVYAEAVPDSEKKAEEAKNKLEEIFGKRCKVNSAWKWIELQYCDIYSDEAFTLRAMNRFQRWRFEHRSLSGEPISAE